MEIVFDATNIVKDDDTQTYWVSGFVEVFYRFGMYEKITITGGFSKITKAILLFEYDDEEGGVPCADLKMQIARRLAFETKYREVKGNL